MVGWMDGWLADWVDGWMDGRTHGWMDGCRWMRIDGWTRIDDGWMRDAPFLILCKFRMI